MEVESEEMSAAEANVLLQSETPEYVERVTVVYGGSSSVNRFKKRLNDWQGQI